MINSMPEITKPRLRRFITDRHDAILNTIKVEILGAVRLLQSHRAGFIFFTRHDGNHRQQTETNEQMKFPEAHGLVIAQRRETSSGGTPQKSMRQIP